MLVKLKKPATSKRFTSAVNAVVMYGVDPLIEVEEMRNVVEKYIDVGFDIAKYFSSFLLFFFSSFLLFFFSSYFFSFLLLFSFDFTTSLLKKGWDQQQLSYCQIINGAILTNLKAYSNKHC